MFWKQRKEEKSFFMLVPVILERLKGEKEILKDVALRCVPQQISAHLYEGAFKEYGLRDGERREKEREIERDRRIDRWIDRDRDKKS